jgi:hypothetical protein
MRELQPLIQISAFDAYGASEACIPVPEPSAAPHRAEEARKVVCGGTLPGTPRRQRRDRRGDRETQEHYEHRRWNGLGSAVHAGCQVDRCARIAPDC